MTARTTHTFISLFAFGFGALAASLLPNVHAQPHESRKCVAITTTLSEHGPVIYRAFDDGTVEAMTDLREPDLVRRRALGEWTPLGKSR